MRPDDKLGIAADSLKWNLLTVAALLVTLYLVRSVVLEARGELEAAKVRAVKAEDALDGALEKIHELGNEREPDAGGE